MEQLTTLYNYGRSLDRIIPVNLFNSFAVALILFFYAKH